MLASEDSSTGCSTCREQRMAQTAQSSASGAASVIASCKVRLAAEVGMGNFPPCRFPPCSATSNPSRAGWVGGSNAVNESQVGLERIPLLPAPLPD